MKYFRSLLSLLFLSFTLVQIQAATPTSAAKISQALRSGTLDAETALVYEVLALVAPDNLPVAYRGTAPEFQKCGTQALRELTRRWAGLSETAKEQLRPYLITTPQLIPKDLRRRNKAAYTHVLPNYYVTANFNIEWGNAIPTYPDTSTIITEWLDMNQNGRPDYVDNLASYLETSWAAEVTGLQLQYPYLTNTYLFNVYIADTGYPAPAVGSGLYGYTATFPYDPGLSGPNNMAYIVMNDDYTGFPANSDPEGSFKGAMKVTVAHEFFHAIQFAYDVNEAGWIMELSSTWMEDQVFDIVNDYYAYLQGNNGWHIYPDTSLTYFNGQHEYGDVIFGKYLSETYPAVNVMKGLWENMALINGNNAVGGLEAFLNARTPASTVSAAFNDFTARNTTMNYLEGDNYGGYLGAKMFYQEAIATYPVINQQYSLYRPDYLGANYILFTNPDSAQPLQISFDGQETFNSRGITWSAAAVAVKPSGAADVYELPLNANGQGQTSVADFGGGGTYDKIFLLCRVLSPTGSTPAEDPPIPYESYPNGVPYSFTAALGGITVSPATAQIPIGTTQLFSATGTAYSITWSTSNPNVGTIDPDTGVFTAISAGTCTVIATDALGFAGVSDTITVTSITIQPYTTNVPLGATQLFTASGGNPAYTWASSDTTVGTIDPTSGVFTPVNVGICTVIVTDSSPTPTVQSSGTITVTSTTIYPASQTLAQNATYPFTAANGTEPYTWASTDPNVGTVDSDGLFTAVGTGTCNLTVTDSNGTAASAVITVTSTTVTPATLTLSTGAQQLFAVSGGTYPYAWTSLNPSVGTIDAEGLFTALAAGTCTIRATDANDVIGSATVTVTATSGGSGGDGDSNTTKTPTKLCGIGAIAAGTPLQDKLDILRAYRERLRKTSWGNKLVTHYYLVWSPAIKKLVESHGWLRWLLRAPLWLLVWLATWSLEGTSSVKILFYFSCLLFLILLPAWKNIQEKRSLADN